MSLRFFYPNIKEVLFNLFSSGVRKSNLYQISFSIDKNSILSQILKSIGIDVSSNIIFSNINKISLLCSQISLPPLSVQTIKSNNTIPGYSINVPTKLSFNDFSATFIVDSQLLVYKFFIAWLRTISPHVFNDSFSSPISLKSRFYNDIFQTLYLYFFPVSNFSTFNSFDNTIVPSFFYENDFSDDFLIKFYDVYPINISSLNLSYSSQQQPLFLTVSFTFRDFQSFSNKTTSIFSSYTSTTINKSEESINLTSKTLPRIFKSLNISDL